MNALHGLMLTLAVGSLAIPITPTSFSAGGCDYDNNGPKILCDGGMGQTCTVGVDTCQSGTELSRCDDGTQEENGGELDCETTGIFGCQGPTLYYAVTNATGCES